MMRYLVVALIPLTLSGCDKLEELGLAKSDKKVLTTGEREAVLITDEVAIPKVSKEAGPVKLPKAEPINEWPQEGHNASHASPHVDMPAEIQQVWQSKLTVKATSNQRLLCEPTVAEGMLFVYTPDSFITAYELETGKSLWSLFVRPDLRQDALLGGGTAYSKGRLFVSTPFAELFAIDIKAGKAVWMAKTNSPLRSAPTIQDGRVYVVSLNNELTVYDEESGKLLWSHAGISENSGILGGCTPSVQGNVVVTPYSSGEVFALQAENGLPLWTENLSSTNRTDSIAGMPHIKAKPVIKDGITYVVSQSGKTAAFDLRTGKTIWEHAFGGSQTPLIAGDSMFMITSDNYILCMEKNKGLVRWVKALPVWMDEVKNKGRIVWNGPILAGSKLYITGSFGTLFAINAEDGTKAEEYRLPGNVVVPPIAVGGTIYVITESGQLVAFRKS